MKKRVLPKKSNANYKKIVKNCLHPKSAGTDQWGCLAKNGLLFRIMTLSHVRIPKVVIDDLVGKNKIYLKEDGYYAWKTKKKK